MHFSDLIFSSLQLRTPVLTCTCRVHYVWAFHAMESIQCLFTSLDYELFQLDCLVRFYPCLYGGSLIPTSFSFTGLKSWSSLNNYHFYQPGNTFYSLTTTWFHLICLLSGLLTTCIPAHITAAQIKFNKENAIYIVSFSHFVQGWLWEIQERSIKGKDFKRERLEKGARP